MGKGRIVSGGEDGLYTVELLHNRDRIERELEFLAARLTEMQAELDALNAEREVLDADRAWIATQIDTAVANTEEGEIPDVEALLVKLAQVSAQIQQQDVRIGMLKGRMLEATKRQEQLESVPEDPQQQAWCADFTEDLTGDVATVEVPAEGVVGQFATWRRVQIRPGFSGRATYNAARDGQMHHRIGQVGYQAYFNAAILPGVQRWRPQYRIGVITSIDRNTDTCSLTIQGEDSSAQSLIIDPPDLQYAKSNVPIEYMDCNSDPFEEGDRVLVEFQGRDWDQPKVIGFESAPRECPAGILCTYAGDLYALRWKEGQGWQARETSIVAGMGGYWIGPGSDPEVVSWGSNRIYVRGVILIRSNVAGACIIGDVVYASRFNTFANTAEVWARNIGTEAPHGWELRGSQGFVFGRREDADGLLRFDQDGLFDIYVRHDAMLGDPFRLTWDGATLALDESFELAATRTTVETLSATNTFKVGCLPDEFANVNIGSTLSRTGGSVWSGALNGYDVTISSSFSLSATAGSGGSTSQLTTISIPLLGIENIYSKNEVNSLNGMTKRYTVYYDPNVIGTAILRVRAVGPGGLIGGPDALSVTGHAPPTDTTVDWPYITSSYIVENGILDPVPFKTETGIAQTSPHQELGLFFQRFSLSCGGEHACSPRPCTVDNPSNGTTTTTGTHRFEILFRPIVIPVDVTGRVLITSAYNQDAAYLTDGDMADLLGGSADYLPVSVSR